MMKELALGSLAFLVALAGAFLMSWSSRWSGFTYWLGTISGLVIFSIGLANAWDSFKSLIRKNLIQGILEMMKSFEMKEWMRVFLSFLSIGAGICFILRASELSYYLAEWIPYAVGIVLIASGITYFWMQSKFYRK